MSTFVRHDLVVNPKRGEALPAGATRGFMWIPNSAGDPGTPSAPEANVTPVIYDSTAKVLKFWDGTAWKSTEGSGGTGSNYWTAHELGNFPAPNAGEAYGGMYPVHPDTDQFHTYLVAGDEGSLGPGYRGGFRMDIAGSLLLRDGGLFGSGIVDAMGFSANGTPGVSGTFGFVEDLRINGGVLQMSKRTLTVNNGLLTAIPSGSSSWTDVPTV
jgi:hypothetical protein